VSVVDGVLRVPVVVKLDTLAVGYRSITTPEPPRAGIDEVTSPPPPPPPVFVAPSFTTSEPDDLADPFPPPPKPPIAAPDK